MASGFYKHKVLLDEGFPPRIYFPRVNQRFDVKHVKNDLRKIGLPDEEVYELAAMQKRLIVTYNAKDFKRFIRRYLSDHALSSLTPTRFVIRDFKDRFEV
jgi:hypothetical protein